MTDLQQVASSSPTTAPQANRPVVSVVTATRNRPVLVRETLLSIKRQTWADLESILVDDGSSAETLEAYRRWWPELDSRFTLHGPPMPDAPGKGPAAGRNRALKLTRGEYLAFCDDDDQWNDPAHLEVAIRTMRENGADLFIANMRGEDAGKIKIPSWFPDSPQLTRGRKVSEQPVVHELALGDLMKTMHHHYVHPNGCVIRKDLLERVGGFWELNHYCEDFDLILRLADQSRGMLYRPDPIVSFNVTPRTSSFTMGYPPDQWLQMVFAGKHIRLTAEHGVVRECARAFEGWALRLLAAYVASEGRRRAALSFAWQSCCVYTAAGAWTLFLRLLMGLPVAAPDRTKAGADRPVPPERRAI
jgi:cellulose synthase/poly-beta-1,6-N-acetylglucosamine synthase-like glycosyltransferase